MPKQLSDYLNLTPDKFYKATHRELCRIASGCVTTSGGEVLSTTLTGFTTGSNTPITSANTVLTAFEDLQAQISAVSTPLAANPTASLGLSTINGVATTYMRSDAAPALSQAIAPTWTQPHHWETNTGLGGEFIRSAHNNSNIAFYDNSNTTRSGYLQITTTQGLVGTSLANPFSIFTNATTRMSIDGAGFANFTGNLNTQGILSSSSNSQIAGVTNSGVTINGGNNFAYVSLFDQQQTANNRTGELIFISGQLQLRLLNDAHSAAVVPLSITGGQAAGITGITSNTGSGRWVNTGDIVVTRTGGNSVVFAGTAASGVPSITTEGVDTNISLQLNTKGAGGITLNSTSNVVGNFSVTSTGTPTVTIGTAGTVPGIVRINGNTSGSASGTLTIQGPTGNTMGILVDNTVTVDNAMVLGGNRINRTITGSYSFTGTLDFPATAAGTSSDLTIAATGAQIGDPVIIGIPSEAFLSDSCYTAFVSAADVVTVRFNNYSSGSQNPASGTFRVSILAY